jgi:hypothetical protein
LKPHTIVAAVVLAACASQGVPPGGPVDTQAPQILRIVPDSGKTGTTPPHVTFRFDEVVAERPTGAQSLSALFLISPRDGDPRVEWHRDELEIRPRKGWRKNTAYTITLLPGLSDLRGNARNTGAVTMFSTGSQIPSSKITGALYNWSESRPFTRGLIEARPRSDTTLVYVGSPDSSGRFTLPNIPPGQYFIRGFSDDNSNRGLDPRESFDTAGVSLSDSSSVELFAFVHDSIGPRLQSVALRDSVTLELSFDNPLALAPPVPASAISVKGPDSVAVGVLTAAPPPLDTTVVVRRLSRAVPSRTLIVKLSRPLKARTRYRVRVTNVRNLTGAVLSSETTVDVPAPPPPAAPAAPPPPPPAGAPKR